jgi:hypothetical protein
MNIATSKAKVVGMCGGNIQRVKVGGDGRVTGKYQILSVYET